MKNIKLTSNDVLTNLVKKNGIGTWLELIEFVKALPYGRNSNRTDLALVITEKKGSCSSKHSLLKQVADLNDIPGIKLILGIYKMDNKNTPNIGEILVDNDIDYIPEAHCYLSVGETRMDITTAQSDFDKVEKDIIQELEISPDQVAEFKVDYHKKYIKKWISEKHIGRPFEEIWNIREQCIDNLSKTK